MEQLKSKMLRYRWIGYILLLAAYFLVNFHKMSLGAVQGNLEEMFGLTAAQYSNLNAAYFYAYALMQIPTGILVDTLGSRKTSFFGCLCMGGGAVLYGFAVNYGMLLAARFAVGLGASSMFLSILKYQTAWFHEREFGRITGFTSFIANIGGAFAQAPLTLLVTWLTWTATFVSIGLLTLLLGSAILLAAANRPEDKGFPPISVIPNREKQAGIAEGMKGVLSCKHIYPVLVVNFCANGIFAATTTWGVPYMTDCFGLSSAEAGSITFFIPLVAAITALLCGQISDRIANRKLVNLLMSTLNMLALFLLYLDWSGGTSLLTCGSVIIFSGSTMFYAINFGLVKDVCNPQYSGMATSVLNVATFIGGSILPSLFSCILSQFGSISSFRGYQFAFGFLSACALVMLIASFFILETNCQNRYWEIREGTYRKSVFSLK